MARENPRVLLRLQAQNLLAPITFYVMKELLKGKRSWKPADEEIIDLVDNSLESDPEKNVAAACRRVAHLLRMKGLDPGRALERRYRRAKAKVMAEARKAKHRRTGGKVR
jgi:hypothetical protein